MKKQEVKILKNKIKFIQLKFEGEIKIEGMKELDIAKLLGTYNFDKIHSEDYFSPSPSSMSIEEGRLEDDDDIKRYNYLMEMTFRDCSGEKVIN